MATGVVVKYADGTDSGWLSFTGTNNQNDDTPFIGTIWYRKIGSMVNVVFNGITLRTELTGLNVTLLGANSLPKPKAIAQITAGSRLQNGLMCIDTNGQMLFYKFGSNSSFPTGRNINGNFTYFTAD